MNSYALNIFSFLLLFVCQLTPVSSSSGNDDMERLAPSSHLLPVSFDICNESFSLVKRSQETYVTESNNIYSKGINVPPFLYSMLFREGSEALMVKQLRLEEIKARQLVLSRANGKSIIERIRAIKAIQLELSRVNEEYVIKQSCAVEEGGFDSSSSQETTIHLLPKDILALTFLYLDAKSFYKARQVCKKWYSATESQKYRLPDGDEDLKIMLMQEGAESLFSLVAKVPNGLHRLKDFYLSYLTGSAEGKIFCLSDSFDRIEFTSQYKAKVSGYTGKEFTMDDGIQYAAVYESSWKPYGYALFICQSLGELKAVELCRPFVQGTTNKLDRIISGVYRKVDSRIVYDENAEERFATLQESCSLSALPYSMMRAAKGYDRLDRKKHRAIVANRVKMFADVLLERVKGFDKEDKKVRKEILEKAANSYEVVLSLKGASATLQELVTTATAFYKAHDASTEAKERDILLEMSIKYSEYVLSLKQVQGTEGIVENPFIVAL